MSSKKHEIKPYIEEEYLIRKLMMTIIYNVMRINTKYIYTKVLGITVMAKQTKLIRVSLGILFGKN